jgi:hypothetical protein
MFQNRQFFTVHTLKLSIDKDVQGVTSRLHTERQRFATL